MLKITNHIALPETEIQITFVRSPGPGGQHVNKTATGAQLRFNIPQSTALPEEVKNRLMMLARNNISTEGDLLIKATRYRSQDRNKQDARERLRELIKRACIVPKKRKKTKPTLAAKKERLANKKLRGQKKSLRSKMSHARE